MGAAAEYLVSTLLASVITGVFIPERTGEKIYANWLHLLIWSERGKSIFDRSTESEAKKTMHDMNCVYRYNPLINELKKHNNDAAASTNWPHRIPSKNHREFLNHRHRWGNKWQKRKQLLKNRNIISDTRVCGVRWISVRIVDVWFTRTLKKHVFFPLLRFSRRPKSFVLFYNYEFTTEINRLEYEKQRIHFVCLSEAPWWWKLYVCSVYPYRVYRMAATDKFCLWPQLTFQRK